MNEMDKKAYVFGTIFTLANRLQLLGNRLDDQLTVKQWLFLAGVMKCHHEAPTLTEVAALIGTSRQNVKKIASILERQEFLIMENDPEDARALRIKLTESCMEYLKQREGMEARFIEDLFYGFRSEEIFSLAELLEKLEENLCEMGERLEEKE